MTERDTLFLGELLVSIAIIIVLIVLLDPFSFFVPRKIFVLVSLELAVNFGLFASFIAREQATDRHPSFRGMLSEKLGYLAGGILLVFGITIQTVRGDLDRWLVLVLGSMVLVKMLALVKGKARA